MCSISKSTWVIILAIGAALWIQFMKKNRQCDSKTDLTGKTVVVTGGNTGIGYETALDMARRNAKVIIACRNEAKAEKAVAEIKETTGTMTVQYLIVDLAEIADVRHAAENFVQTEDRLDILINNAGVATWGKTKDGFDAMFGVNHLGYFMLTNLLMPLMRKTAKTSPVRIINVSSAGHMVGTIDFDNLNPDITKDSSVAAMTKQYCNTKLMNVYFTSELDARLKEVFKGEKQAITTYSLHPGAINTNLGGIYSEGNQYISKILRKIFFIIFGQPMADGAQTSICCAVEEGIEQYSGRYFSNVQPVELQEHACDREIGRKLWILSEQLSGVQWFND